MYIFYTKEGNSVVAITANMKNDLFNNTDNIDEILNTCNKSEMIKAKIKEYSEEKKNASLNQEEVYDIKIQYLNKQKKLIEKKLLNLFHEGEEVFSEKKENIYVHSTELIKDLNNKLALIDFYLKIRNALLNKTELNIEFDRNENQSKKLKFISLCARNFNNPENFLKKLINLDDEYSIKQKQKKLI